MNSSRDLSGSDPQLNALKTPPHSIEAEQSVLGGLLLENWSLGQNWRSDS